MCSTTKCCADIAIVEDHSVDRLGTAHLPVQALSTRQDRRLVPSDLQLASGSHSIPFIRRQHPNEIAFTNHAGFADGGDGCLLDAHHAGAVPVSALAART